LGWAATVVAPPAGSRGLYSIGSNKQTSQKKFPPIMAQARFWVQALGMRKTSELIWQDAQHQKLFEILDLLKAPEADRGVLRRLQAYTEYHFELEEQYMLLLDFPGREAHIAAHNRFRDEIGILLREEAELDAQFRDLISTFLTEWLSRHVFGIDKELEAFILGAGVN
jgi:hemerythrin